jgi:hypothetical protein
MTTTTHLNSSGVPLGPRDYVTCRVCGEEVPGISRETRAEYALCLADRAKTRNQTEEGETMPSAPKPSSKKRKKAAKGARRANGNGGAYGEILAKAQADGGWTPSDIRAECARRKLTKNTSDNYVTYLRKAGAVREERAAA